jgi:hypothetical protein
MSSRLVRLISKTKAQNVVITKIIPYIFKEAQEGKKTIYIYEKYNDNCFRPENILIIPELKEYNSGISLELRKEGYDVSSKVKKYRKNNKLSYFNTMTVSWIDF